MDISTIPAIGYSTRIMGLKRYELTNHLGNVLTVITDRRFGTQQGTTGMIKYYEADVVQANDYYPFGLMMLGRSWSEGYRYGFNGKEQDAESMGGNGSTYDYGFRVYNPAIAKFLSIDPLTSMYPWFTPYQYASNMPIKFIDIDGLEAGVPASSRKSKLDILQSKDVQSELELARKEMSKAFFGEFDPGLAISLGIRAVKLGPIKIDNVKYVLLSVKGETVNSNPGIGIEILGATADVGLGDTKIESSYFAGKWKVYNDEDGERHVDTDHPENFADGLDISLTNKGTELTLENSLEVGGGINLLGTDISFGVNLSHLAKAGGHYFNSLVNYSKQLFSRKPDSNTVPKGIVIPLPLEIDKIEEID